MRLFKHVGCHDGKEVGDVFDLASRSDVLEWLGNLTRREKLELLEWEKCKVCGGWAEQPTTRDTTKECTCHLNHRNCQCHGGWEPCPNCLSGLVPPASQVETYARLFHENYERLAPKFGYETRKATRTPWPPANADLMRATVRAALIAAMREGVGDE